MNLNYRKTIQLLVFPILFFSVTFICCKKKTETIVIDGFGQGSTYHLILISNDTLGLKRQVDSLLTMLDNSMSPFVPNSLINRLNNNDTDSIDELITYCVNTSAKISDESDGMFDITILPITEAWGFAKREYEGTPNLDSLIQYVGYKKISAVNGRLIKENPNVRIDLQTIAQGYSADKLAELMDKRGIKNYLVEIGGEMYARGTNYGKKWKIPIDRPAEGNFLPGEDIQVVLEITNKGIATSGNYKKFFIDENGRKVTHMLNPKTGVSVISNLLSATIIADNTALADAYGTMIMVIGFENGVKFMENRDDIMGYLVYTDSLGNYNTYYTSSLRNYIKSEK